MCLRGGELLESENVEYAASQLLPPGALTDDTPGELPRPAARVRESAARGHRVQLFRRDQRLRGVSQRDRGGVEEHSLAGGAGADEHAARTQRAGAIGGDQANGGAERAGGRRRARSQQRPRSAGRPAGRHSRAAPRDAVGGESARDLRADIEAIKVASLRAAQTIKDLLALGRQGRMAKENLDINRVDQIVLRQQLPSLRRGGQVSHQHDHGPQPHSARRPGIGVAAGAGRSTI